LESEKPENMSPDTNRRARLQSARYRFLRERRRHDSPLQVKAGSRPQTVKGEFKEGENRDRKKKDELAHPAGGKKLKIDVTLTRFLEKTKQKSLHWLHCSKKFPTGMSNGKKKKRG